VPLHHDIDLDGAATLVVAWRSGRQAHARTVRAGGDVTDVLRDFAKASLRLVGEGQGRPYSPDNDQEAEESYLTANQDELLDTALVQQVLHGASLPLISPEDLSSQRLALYALLIGNSAASRAVFVRKSNPVSLASKGLVAIFDNALTRVTQPVLAFDERFDLLLYAGQAWIFNQRSFEALFRESEAVLAQTGQWVENLSQVLPISEEGKQWLTTRLRQNSVMRRKVQSILRSSYLPKLTPELLASKMTEHRLDPDKLIADGFLVFNKETESDVLLLLNEDLWTGDFSGDLYAAARKARI
jgi:Kiwa KwaB-like protein